MYRFFCRIGGVDPTLLEQSPATDRIWAVQLGISLLLNFALVFGLTFYSVGYFIPATYARVLVAFVVASVLMLFDRALFQFDWFTIAALHEVRDAGQLRPTGRILGLLGFVRPLGRLALRLMISLAIAYTLSVFAELAAFENTIRDRLIAENYSDNQKYRDRLAEFEQGLDRRRRDVGQRIVALEEGIAAAQKGVGSRAEQDEYEALRTEGSDIRTRIAAIESRIADNEKRIGELNEDIYAERYGLKDKPNRTGKPGCEPGSICSDLVGAVRDTRESNIKLRQDIERLETRYRQIADRTMDLLKQRGASDDAVIAVRQREIETLRAEASRLEDDKSARLAAYAAELTRDGTHREMRDDPMIRIRVLNELKHDPVQGPGISQMSWLIKAFIAFLELAPVLAKIFFAPPTVYSARIRAVVALGQSRALHEMTSQLRMLAQARELASEPAREPARVDVVKVPGIQHRPVSEAPRLEEGLPQRPRPVLPRPARDPPPRPQVSPDALDKFAVPLLQRWIGTDPQRKQSAGTYYMVRLAQGHVLFEPDLAIATYCSRHFPMQTRFFELGFGFGELSLCLALNGFRTVGFEADTGRFEGATAVVAALARQGVDTSALSLVNGIYPEALAPYIPTLTGPSVLVSTNVTGDIFKLDEILQSLTHFDHAIVDLSRFGAVRDGTSQRSLVERLKEFRFREAARLYSSGDTDIRHFQNSSRAAIVAGTGEPR